MSPANAWRSLGAIGLIVTASAACADGGGRPHSGDHVALVAIDTLVSTASELLGGAYDLDVSPDGDVHVADFGFKHVLIVGPDGAVRRTIGNEGSGPGEFRLPYVVDANADTVRVLDAQGNLVQVFDRSGEFVRSYRLEAPGLGAGRDFRDDGALGVAIDGFENSMILVVDPTGATVATFGEPFVPAVSSYDFRAIKAQIREGRVPDAFRNRSMTAWGPEGSIYLAFLSEPEVRRYDAAGELLWTRRLDEPVLRSTFENFVQRNIEEQNPSVLHSLQYVTDAEVVDGDLWLLLRTDDEEEGFLLVLGAEDGSVRRRIGFPGLPNTGQFAVDESRRRLYMAPRGEASVLMFDLPLP